MVSAGLLSAIATLSGWLAPEAATPDITVPTSYVDSSFTRVGSTACAGIERRELRFEMLAADAEPVVPAGAGPPVCLAIYRIPDQPTR